MAADLAAFFAEHFFKAFHKTVELCFELINFQLLLKDRLVELLNDVILVSQLHFEINNAFFRHGKVIAFPPTKVNPICKS